MGSRWLTARAPERPDAAASLDGDEVDDPEQLYIPEVVELCFGRTVSTPVIACILLSDTLGYRCPLAPQADRAVE